LPQAEIWYNSDRGNTAPNNWGLFYLKKTMTKPATIWRPADGTGDITTDGGDYITTQIGDNITDQSGNKLITNPST
jgi:hypothetical protein